jgi:hypothetical protein
MLLWTATSSTGCFSYVPLETGAGGPALGDEIRAHLSQPDRVQLEHVAAENVIQVDGEFINWDDQRLVLSAFWVKANTGLEFRGVGETVVLNRTSIATVEKKKISPVGTAAIAALIAAVAIFGGLALGSGGFGSEGPGPPPPQQ